MLFRSWCKELLTVDQIKFLKFYIKDKDGNTLTFLKDHTHSSEFISGFVMYQENKECLLRYVVNSCKKNGVILTIDSGSEELDTPWCLEKISIRF